MKLNKSLLLIILLAAILRLYKITDKSLWFDELGELYASSSTLSHLISVVQTHLSPPLDYVILWLTLKITPNIDFYIRLPSLIWGILSVLTIYLLAEKIAKNNSVSLLSAFFLSISPLAIQYSQEVRPYSLFLFLSILSFYFFLQTEKQRYYILWILSNIFLIYTHYFAIFIFFIQIGWLLYIVIAKKQYSFNEIMGLGIVAIAFSIWMPVFNQQIQNGIISGLIPQSLSFERNLIFLLPFFLIFISWIIVKVYNISPKFAYLDVLLAIFIGIFIVSINVVPSFNYYISQKEDWKGAGQYLIENANSNDTIAVIGGIPEFLQHYTKKPLQYQTVINYSNTSYFLVSSWSNQFGLNQQINRTQLIRDLTSKNYQKIEFYQFTLYKVSN